MSKLLEIYSIELDKSPVFYFNIVLRDKSGAPIDTMKVEPSKADEIFNKIYKTWWDAKLKAYNEKEK